VEGDAFDERLIIQDYGKTDLIYYFYFNSIIKTCKRTPFFLYEHNEHFELYLLSSNEYQHILFTKLSATDISC
jgi:hypothetical protein